MKKIWVNPCLRYVRPKAFQCSRLCLTLGIKLAVLRKARVANNWSRARDIVSGIVWRTRTGRDKAQWPDVVERVRQEAVAQQRAQRGRTLPARRRLRVHLHLAVVVGPVRPDGHVAPRPRRRRPARARARAA